MPIYEYSCQSCGKTIDVLQKVSDPAPEACTACGAAGSLSKIVSRSSFVLKGGGWYADLYSSTKKDGSSNSSDSGSASGSGTASNSSSDSGGTSSSSSGGGGGSTGTSSSSPAPVAAAPAKG